MINSWTGFPSNRSFPGLPVGWAGCHAGTWLAITRIPAGIPLLGGGESAVKL